MDSWSIENLFLRTKEDKALMSIPHHHILLLSFMFASHGWSQKTTDSALDSLSQVIGVWEYHKSKNKFLSHRPKRGVTYTKYIFSDSSFQDTREEFGVVTVTDSGTWLFDS